MRPLIVVLVLALVASVAPVAAASAGPPGTETTTVQKSTTSKSKSNTTSKSKSKNTSKSKSKKTSGSKKKSSSESVTLDDISSVKHGKSGVEITASVSKAGLTCDLKIKYADGSSDSPDSVTSAKDKTCTFEIDIPNNSGVAGDATAEVILKDASGKKLASDKKSFTVK